MTFARRHSHLFSPCLQELCPQGTNLSSHTQTRSTHLRSLVPPGWAGLGSSAVVISLSKDGPGQLGPTSSARTVHGCSQAGDTTSGCPSPEQPSRDSRLPEWQPAGEGSPTSTVAQIWWADSQASCKESPTNTPAGCCCSELFEV